MHTFLFFLAVIVVFIGRLCKFQLNLCNTNRDSLPVVSLAG